ncbi:MAG: DUF2156 domain-containing protein [Muribaculaceae bacterium]|nr:DUF2156 domain-containing protein [Muribaculaceae bacterium]
MTLTFHPLTLSDRESVQAISLYAGRRNCNFTFANLVGWQFWFNTEVCVLEDVVVLRYTFKGEWAYMVCTATDLQIELIEALLEDSKGKLTLIGLDDSQAQALDIFRSRYTIEIEPCRDLYNYIYRRDDLASLRGRHLNAKRNHINRFRAEHPDFEYRPLTPELFDECRHLTKIWQEEKEASVTINAEKRVMETIFSHWDSLGMIGGSIFVDGSMVAFTYGSALTTDTFDICVEKADRRVEGAFAIINQQFAQHLSEQYTYLNREEDMGLPGLRKAKLSYHPEILLSYNEVHIA